MAMLVFHLSRRVDDKHRIVLMMGSEGFEERAASLLALGFYDAVASLPADSDLDSAFDKTNHQSEMWNDPEVLTKTGVVALPAGICARSTSVGDVVLCDGAFHVCAPIGWVEITGTYMQAVAAIQITNLPDEKGNIRG